MSARLFVALELPEATRELLDRWRADTVGSLRGARLVPPESLHATLCFLGSQDVDEIEPIGAACAEASGGHSAPELAFGDAVWLPARRPRVLAVQLKDSSGRLERLQAALTEALSGGGWYASEFRRFFPHVTIARLGRGERTRADRLEAPPGHRFKGTALTLYRSWLGGAGAAYEPQRTIRLSEDPVEAVTRFHVEQRHAYAGGELEPLRARLTEDIVWHVPGRSRIAGDHRGIDDVLAYFDARRRLTDETFRITVHGVSVIDGRVVQLAGGTAVRNGRELCWETVGVFRVEDGRIAEAWLVPFDQQAFDEIWG